MSCALHLKITLLIVTANWAKNMYLPRYMYTKSVLAVLQTMLFVTLPLQLKSSPKSERYMELEGYLDII